MGDKKYPCSYVKEESVLLKYDIIYIVILDNIKTRYGYWNKAYVITTKKEDVTRLQRELNADEVINLECTKEEALERLRKENLPKFIENNEAKLIKDWYRLYGN